MRSRRDAEPGSAHHVVPVFACGARGGNQRSLDVHCGSGVTVRTRNHSTVFVALDEQWLSLLKVGVGLNPNLQITGAVMADIGHVFCKARFQRYCCLVNLDIGKNLAVLRVNLNARKILQSAERYVILQLLDLHIIAERGQEWPSAIHIGRAHGTRLRE